MYHHSMGVANDAVGIPIDLTEAARLYRFAAGQGLANAQFNLGLMYELGEGMSNDSPKAVRLYRLAADQGLPHAQNRLDEMYAEGEGRRSDRLCNGGAAVPFGGRPRSPSGTGQPQPVAPDGYTRSKENRQGRGAASSCEATSNSEGSGKTRGGKARS
jgi:TPR repeat protein